MIQLHTCFCPVLNADFTVPLPPDAHMRDLLLSKSPGKRGFGTAATPRALYARALREMANVGMFPYSSTAHDAATKISRAWRALIYRRRRAVTLFQVCTVDCLTYVSLVCSPIPHTSLHVQAAWRGRRIRRRFRDLYLKATAAAMRIQAMARGNAVRRFIAYHKVRCRHIQP